MRNRQEIEQWLQVAFEAPRPQRKKSFLRSLKRRRMSNSQFVRQQAAYIRKRTWALSFAVFFAALAGGYYVEGDALWLLAAMMPFLALSSVAEFNRSEACGMAELEMAARFGLKSALLARMAILGMLHIVTLCIASIMGSRGGISVFRTGIYLLVPYLLTDTAALWLSRKLRGREAVYAGAGAAVLVEALFLLARYAGWGTLQGSAFKGWLIAAALLVLTASSEWKKSIKGTEELVWN